jgi:hypothetical protein
MEWIRLLKETPVPTILVLAGIFFLLLAVAGGIAGKINILPGRQRISLGIGVVLLLVGIIIYLVPTTAQSTAAPTSTSTPAPTTGPSEGIAPGLVQPKLSGGHLDLLSTARGWPTVEKDVFSGSETNWCQEEGTTFDKVVSTRRISDGKYRWQLKFNSPLSLYCAPTGGESLNDFYAAVDAKLVSGPSVNVHYGLQLRVVGDPVDGYYVLMITDNQYWKFARWLGKEWKEWGWILAKGIHTGEYNRLEIVAEGTRFHFYINGASAGYYDDDAIPLGRTGLYVDNTTAAEAVVDFDNFELRKKPE